MEESFEKSKLSDEQQIKVASLDETTRIALTGFVNRKEFRHLGIDYRLNLLKSKNLPKITIDSNADFNIQSSLSFLENVKKLTSSFDVSWLPRDCQIHILLNFKIKESSNKLEKEGENSIPAFIPISPKYTFEQVILPDEVRKEIFNALSVIENRKLIYEDWGFGEVEPTPRSIINFYGAPGTGKSMCAHAIAAKMEKPLLALNYADIESKYVGEAAKNLKKAFETATELGAVMFFDEADSFLGKRIENVTQGSDQALNSLRSQMLIYLENFSGVVIFATNLVTNFDQAFNSRILSHIKFELPNKEARAAIIAKMIPAKLPKDHEFTEEEYLEASDLIEGLSGREIKTAIQTMLLNEAAEHGKDAIFTIDILKEALKSKKESIEKLKAEEQLRLKAKITKKLQEKSMENKAMEEQEASKAEAQIEEGETTTSKEDSQSDTIENSTQES